jgi:6-phosphogluconolactonase (cycloisomerase 2 family)
MPPAGHRRLVALVAAIGFLALCAGSAAASPIGFAYALLQVNNGTNQIYGFRFEPGTGTLTLLPGFPVASGGTGTSQGVSEQLAYLDGRLYVLNDGDNTMTAFSVNRSTGALNAMPFPPVALDTGDWFCLAVHPSGSPVVVGNRDGTIRSFVVTDTTATAIGSPSTTASARPVSCRFSEDGAHFYTGGNSGTTIAGFSVNAGTGALSALAGSPFDSGAANPAGYATDSSGRLFSVMRLAAEVRAFTTAAGVPTGVSGNPFASGLSSAAQGVLHPGGFYMVADRTGNRVGVYAIAGTSAATTLTAVSGSPFASGGSFTSALAVMPDGAHLLAANGSSRNLTVFQVNQSTGALTTVGVQAVDTLGAQGVVTGLAFAMRDADFVYALRHVNGGANQIYGFRFDPSSGTLTALPGFPIGSGGTGLFGTGSEHLAYRNRRLYVVNDGNDTLTAFSVDRGTGALTALAFSPLTLGAGSWRCVAVHPSGSPVVVGNSGGGLASFAVSAGATAAPGSPFATGTALPFSCAFNRDGSHVYTGGSGGSRVAGFNVDAGTGVLTALAGSPFDAIIPNPRGYATDSHGRLFIVSGGASEVGAFTTSAGIPTGVSGNPFDSNLAIGLQAVRHQAAFYMAAGSAVHGVGVYRIAGSGAATTLSAVTGSPFAAGGTGTSGLALTKDGAFLIAANGSSRNLAVFQVNPVTGRLTSLGVQAANTLGATGNIIGMVLAPVVQTFTDDPLTALTAVIKAVHITELRSRIDAVRAQYGLGPYPYTDPVLTIATTVAQAVHITDLRAALAEIYTATEMTQPSYTDQTLAIGSTVVKLAHIAELRAAVIAIE